MRYLAHIFLFITDKFHFHVYNSLVTVIAILGLRVFLGPASGLIEAAVNRFIADQIRLAFRDDLASQLPIPWPRLFNCIIAAKRHSVPSSVSRAHRAEDVPWRDEFQCTVKQTICPSIFITQLTKQHL